MKFLQRIWPSVALPEGRDGDQ